MDDFKHIEIKSIQADPNQPRKFFDESALQELTDSVRTKGILQPILVRPAGKDGYILVCGERRYKAAYAVMAAIKDRNTIPAVIRELTDEQALELQIVENLQRKDVHPMEEAVAFKSLLDHKQLDIQEIAARVGKSIFYVRQRLRLNDLTECWQKTFFTGHISIKAAVSICQLSPDAQDSLFESVETEDLEPGELVDIDDWGIRNFRGSLKSAPFDLQDESLVSGVTACGNCHYNSSVSLLFPDEAKDPRCANVKCFEAKCHAHLSRELQAATEDPTVLLVSNNYHLQGRAKKLIDEGYFVLASKDFDDEEQPEPPVVQELRDKYEDELAAGEKTESDILQEFDELWIQHVKELKQFQKRIESGKFKKAFVVEGAGAGQYIYVTLRQNAEQKAAQAAVASGDSVTTGDIEAEIARLKEREKRNQELDAEKVHKRLVGELKIHPGFYDGKNVLLDNEYIALGILLYVTADHTTGEWIAKKLKFNRYDWDNMPLYKKLSGVNSAELKGIVHSLIRRSLMDKLVKDNDNPYKIGRAAAMRAIAIDFMPALVQLYDEEQGEVATKREAKVNSRIDELKKQLKALQPVTTPAKKKSSPKK
ncbi:ParB/RepB/Spo0J family partition protein [Chitinophaga sp. YIM B06452]|uniref:ParB/RepB/Spo0J family partition protein n=1 Tax=Chitinophaga sp. YIM B06452 TaxID=3082158 RepID=UPI0031FED817